MISMQPESNMFRRASVLVCLIRFHLVIANIISHVEINKYLKYNFEIATNNFNIFKW